MTPPPPLLQAAATEPHWPEKNIYTKSFIPSALAALKNIKQTTLFLAILHVLFVLFVFTRCTCCLVWGCFLMPEMCVFKC